jgi:hypothetical protein
MHRAFELGGKISLQSLPPANMSTRLFAPTAPTQFVEANGIRFAYRRFGEPDSVPLVLIQHFTDTMDHWDPAATVCSVKSSTTSPVVSANSR